MTPDQTVQTHDTQRPLKIAMLTNNYFPFIGGVPISIYRLAKGLKNMGHTVYIFAPKYPRQEVDTDPTVLRFKLLIYLKAKLYHFPIVNIFTKAVEKEFVKYDFDIIHVHHPFWMGKKGLELGKKYGLPVVLTFHTRYDRYYKNLPILKLLFKNVVSHRMVKKFCEQCSSIIAPTDTAQKYLMHLGVTKTIDILPTGVEYRELSTEQEHQSIRRQYADEDEYLLCSVSRLAIEKNIYFLLSCMEYVKDHSDIKFKCIIVGTGPEKNKLEKKILEKGLQDTLLLVDSISSDEVYKYYLASDVFVFASKSETQGMVLIEAMAGKCPIVAVSAGGVNDVVEDGHNGYKTEEDMIEWSEKLISLLRDKEKIREMSQNAYEYSKSYSLEAIALRASEIYWREVEQSQHENPTGKDIH